MSDFITEVVNPVREEILEKYTGTEKIVKIPEGINEIKNSAFEGTEIEEVVFPES